MVIDKEIRKELEKRINEKIDDYSFEDSTGSNVISVCTVKHIIRSELGRRFKENKS